MAYIIVTNDDGIDSVGLAVLARAMVPLGDVLIAAPDSEYSGFGAAFGPLHLLRPEVREVEIAGVPKAYSVNGPPALCIFLARLGVFGGPPDLVVSGINPGENVGRAIYHSGTVGAALTARNGGFSGVAVSQMVAEAAIEGQGGEEGLAHQRWETAAEVAAVVVTQVLAQPPAQPVVVNLNVPNLPCDELKGWRETEVGLVPPRTIAEAHLLPKEGHAGAYHVEWSLGDTNSLPSHVDGGAVTDGWVSISWLSRLVNDNPGSAHVDRALDEFFLL